MLRRLLPEAQMHRSCLRLRLGAAIFPPWTQSRHTPDTPQVPRRQLPAGREVKCCHSSSPWESHAQKQKPPLFDGKRKHSEPTEAFC